MHINTSVRRASRGSEQLTMGSKGEKVSHSRCFLRNKLKFFRINQKIIPGQRAVWDEWKRPRLTESSPFLWWGLLCETTIERDYRGGSSGVSGGLWQVCSLPCKRSFSEKSHHPLPNSGLLLCKHPSHLQLQDVLSIRGPGSSLASGPAFTGPGVMGATHQGEGDTQPGWKQRAQPLGTCLRPQEKPLTSFQIGEILLSALFTWEWISVWRGLYVVGGEAPKV